MLLALLLSAAPAPSPPPPRAVVHVRATARIVRPVRLQGGRAEARELAQLRRRPGLTLVEFQ